jgi:hypothetical protein
MIKSAIGIALMSGVLLSSCVASGTGKVQEAEARKPVDGLMNGSPAGEAAAMAKPQQKGCMPSVQALDSLLSAIQDARKSDDKAKMNAALAAMEIHIAGMKEHKRKCKGMMEDMMGGEGMMGMKGMQAKDADSAAAPIPKEPPKTAPSGHEKHH